MKQSLYKNFKQKVIGADEKNPIWCAGFYFVDLTTKQSNDLYDALYSKYGKDNIVTLPNGIQLRKVAK